MSTPQADSQTDVLDQPVADSPLSDPSPPHVNRDRSSSPEGPRPPLPPRPNTLSLLNDDTISRATLQAGATTAVSRAEVDTQAPDGGGSAYSTLAIRGLSRGLKARASLSQLTSSRASEAGDTASIRSSIQNGVVGDVEALFKDFVTSAPGGHSSAASLLHFPEFPTDDMDDDEFLLEFEPVGELDADAGK